MCDTQHQWGRIMTFYGPSQRRNPECDELLLRVVFQSRLKGASL